MFSLSNLLFFAFIILGCIVPVIAWNLRIPRLAPKAKRYLALLLLVLFSLLTASIDGQAMGGFWVVFTRAFLIDNLAFIVLAPGFLAIQQPASK